MAGWSIELRERALDAPYGVADNALLAWGQGKAWGPDAGHSYLALVDDTGAVVSTMEGNAYTPADGTLVKGEQSLAGFASAAAHELGLSGIFNKAAKWMGYDLNIPRLRVTIEDGPDSLASHDTVTQSIITGEMNDILRRWTAAAEAAAAVNHADLLYQGVGLNNFGVNCHTITGAMMDVMDIPPGSRPDFIFAAPGSSDGSIRNLHENVPALFEYGPNTLAGLDSEYLKGAYNQAKIDLAESLVSPELREQILAREAEMAAPRTHAAYGYGVQWG